MSSLSLSLIAFIPFLLYVLAPVVLVIIVIILFKRRDKRAEERLTIEKQQTFNLQKRVDELNERVIKIENLLKEVE